MELFPSLNFLGALPTRALGSVVCSARATCLPSITALQGETRVGAQWNRSAKLKSLMFKTWRLVLVGSVEAAPP